MKIKFNGKKQPGFYAEVKQEVDEYFKTKNISKNANSAMVFKTIFFLGAMVAIYCIILFGGLSLTVILLLAALLGIVHAFIGFNVSHDAIHGSYSSSSTVNDNLSRTFYFLGASPYMWKITHNLVHHTFTNIPGHDEDLDVAPGLVRVCPNEEKKPIMRYQQFYAFLLYGFASLSWVIRKDYVKFFQKKIGQTDNSNHPKIEYFNLFFFKALYYIMFLVVPFLVLSITWWQLLIGFLVMHLAEGFVLGLVFQLAHVVEGTQFPEPDLEGRVDESWAIHQMQTTANFSTQSKIATFLCGGLNFQIEHHLFANVCHIHYPELSKIVRRIAAKYDVPYIENPTFLGALHSHYKTLKKFGREEVMEPVNA